jgi:hypothetical protein
MPLEEYTKVLAQDMIKALKTAAQRRRAPKAAQPSKRK